MMGRIEAGCLLTDIPLIFLVIFCAHMKIRFFLAECRLNKLYEDLGGDSALFLGACSPWSLQETSLNRSHLF